jgi:hypothetical protein
MCQCERCGTETKATTMSMFNTDVICMPCKETERAHPRYEEACTKENAEIKKGNFNFEGIGWDGLTYEERIKWFVSKYYESGMEYLSLLETMKNEDLDNFKWYGEIIKFPKFKHEI